MKYLIKIRYYFQEIFYVLTGALIIFIVMEFAWPNIVLGYIDMNWVLIIWGIVCIVILIINV